MILPVHRQLVGAIGIARTAKRIFVALITPRARRVRGAVVVPTAACVDGALGLGSSSIFIPVQGSAIATTVGAVAHVLADLRDILRRVRVGRADPDDGSWVWAISGLTDTLFARDGRS